MIVDVSTYQQNINKEKMLSKDPWAMIIRAGSIDSKTGACYYDYRVYENEEKFAGELPLGYYWYFRPEFSGVLQAQYYCGILENLRVDILPAIDVESNLKYVSQGQLQTRIKEFIDYVDNYLKTKSIIYTRATFWNPNVGNPSWAKDHPLWIAMYNNEVTHPWNGLSSSYKPLPWDDYFLWQWSADSNGLGSSYGVATSGIDLDRVNMTRENFLKLINWNEDIDPEPDPDNIMLVTAKVLNFRYGAGTNFGKIGQLYKDAPVEIITKDEDWCKVNVTGWVHEDYLK